MSASSVRGVGIIDMLFFFGVLLVGFAYLWHFGYLDWVRSAATTSIKADYQPGIDLREQARSPPGLKSPHWPLQMGGKGPS